jgi:RIO kinase 1
MEFIGEGGVPYPKMKDVTPKAPKRTFKKLIKTAEILYRKAGLIHSDLSEYNVLLTPEPVLIDFSMGTDIANPVADELLMRDLSTLVRYFRKLGLKTDEPAELFSKIKGE